MASKIFVVRAILVFRWRKGILRSPSCTPDLTGNYGEDGRGNDCRLTAKSDGRTIMSDPLRLEVIDTEAT